MTLAIITAICGMLTQLFRVIANGQEIILATPVEQRDEKLVRLDRFEKASFALIDPLLTLIIDAANKAKEDVEAKNQKDAK